MTTGGLSDAGLSDAALRDLGLTPAEFAAAGELGKQAAAVAAALRDVQGYLGTRIEDGSILVAGEGADLETALAGLKLTVLAVALETVPATLPSDATAEDTPAHTASAETAPPSDGSGNASGIPAASGTEASPGTEFARSTQQLYQAYLREVGPTGLQAVAYTGSRFVIRTGAINTSEADHEDGGAQESADPDAAASKVASVPAPAGKISAEEFVARYANVELTAGDRLTPEADVPGGLGYAADTGYVCSTGFAAFDPSGVPAVLTAGHCTTDGTAASATLQFLGTPAGRLGDFGFSQFGGTGNSTILRPDNSADPGNVGTDVAVINRLRADVDPMPAASTWGDLSEPDPDVKVIGTSAPLVGMPVCRSGRTSAWSCGTIDEVGIYVVPGHGFADDPLDLRAFTGFLSFGIQSSGGDSGGPWLSGNYAVGTHSAGEEAPKRGQPAPVNFAVAATLQDSLQVLPGYQLEVFLNKPTVSSPAAGATFDAGQTVTGMVAAAPASAVAAGSNVKVTVAGAPPFEVPVDANGAWSFTAPDVTGPLRFTAETVNGFSASGAVAFEFAAAAEVAPPVVSPPAGTPAAVPVVSPLAEPPAAVPAAGPTAEPPAAVPAAGPPAETPAAVPAVGPTAETPAAVPAANGSPAPAGGAAVVVLPLGDEDPGTLASTGVSGLFLAAGLAAAALAVGAVLLALVRRRKRLRTAPSK